jgi:hypothetical protein
VKTKCFSYPELFCGKQENVSPKKYGKNRITRGQVYLFCAKTTGDVISGQIWALAEFAHVVCDEIPCLHMSIFKDVLKIMIWNLGGS